MNRCWPRWLSHRNGEEAAGAVTTPKTSASPEPISLNQPEYHRENVRKVQKPYRKPCEKSLKRRITVRISVWLAPTQPPFLFRLNPGGTSLALPWRPSASGNVPAKTGRNGTPPRPQQTLAQTPGADKPRYAVPVGGMSGRITGRQRNENRGCAPNVPQTYANVPVL